MGELLAYLRNGDSPAWHLRTDGWIRLQSQEWRGIPWLHDVSLHGENRSDTAILVVTGGEPNSLDEDEAIQLSSLSRLPVATLYQIPNQPLFEELFEDDLIAFSFIQYLATGESDWPLLLPMVKSVISAIEAIEHSHGIHRFVVTGISKRGWTSWLAGATQDPRIVGIAPMSIDHLDIPKQMKHQLATWGEYSEQIRPYTELELPKQLDSPEGIHLNSIVDPYCYRDQLRCPLLIVNGTNDPYWQVDALGLYWQGLPEPKWARVIPNVEHILDKEHKNATLAAFAMSLGDRMPIQMPAYCWSRDGYQTVLQTETLKQIRLWGSYSPSYEFRDKPWSVLSEGMDSIKAMRPPSGLMALMAEWPLDYKGVPYSLTTPVLVVDRLGPRLPN